MMIISRVWQLLIWRLHQIDTIWWILFLSVVTTEVILFCKMKNNKCVQPTLNLFVLIPYSLLILVVTVLSRDTISDNYWLISFDVSTAWTIGSGIYGAVDSWFETIMNVLMFVPIGYLLQNLTKRVWITLVIGFIFTVIIESLQLFTKRGFFELPDILLNFAGSAIGCIIAVMLNTIISRRCRNDS